MATKAYKEGKKEGKTGKSGSKMHEKKESASYKRMEMKGEKSVKKGKK